MKGAGQLLNLKYRIARIVLTRRKNALQLTRRKQAYLMGRADR
jgi:hypothetical protein